MEDKILVKNFSKNYGKFPAVKSIDLTGKEGEIIGFVGKNGAGKTTTIHAMLNFIKPTSGKISIGGLDSISHSKDIKKITGYMPGEVMYHEGLRVKDLIKFTLKFTESTMEEAIKLMNHFELDMNKKIFELSFGNKKKVSIVQALLRKGDFLILDEPTSGLDPIMQQTFFNTILNEKKRGVTVFLSSHNVTEIEKYCDKVYIIRDGIIVKTVDMNKARENRAKIVRYEDSDGKWKEYAYEGDMKELLMELSNMNIKNLEITHKSIMDDLMNYYGEEKNHV